MKLANDFAQVTWRPYPKETKAMSGRSHFNSLGRVDQIWPWLSKKHGQVIAVQAPHAVPPESFSYSELEKHIANAASAFTFWGIRPNDVVALISENSPRWLIADQGIMRVDAIDAVRGASAPSDELKYILDDSEAVALVVQNQEVLAKMNLSDNQISRLKLIVQLEDVPSKEGVLSWEAFLTSGLEQNPLDVFCKREANSAGTTTATILYTSGTTGRPKGVPLSHENLLHQIKTLACVANPPVASPVLSVLPIWHSYERSAEYFFFSCGCTQNYTSIKHLKNDLPRVRPIVMATVPRLWEAVKQGFDDALKSMPSPRRRILKTALANSLRHKRAVRTLKGFLIEKVSPSQRAKALVEAALRWPFHKVSKTLLWPKVLDKLCGGRLLFPINGGGAIAPDVDAFFEAIGVEMLVGYGLTETSPVVSCRRPWKNIRGTAGEPLPETEFKIVDLKNGALMQFRQKGRVLVKGPQVMNGYLRKPQATAKVLSKDGWFDTGDIGMLLPDGSLVLTGRAKDTIVLSSGENIEPAPLEEYLLASPLFLQIILVGQDQKQLAALIVPKIEAVFTWASKNGLTVSEDLGGFPGDKELRKILRKEINCLLARRKVSRPDERICDVALVAPFTIENGMLTQTLKQRRDKIAARESNIIASIYGH